MPDPEITIVDYGMGNIGSVQNALQYLGAKPRVSSDPNEIAAAPALLLPGVGSFRQAMEALRQGELDHAIRHAVLGRGSKILGICLGMQLLGVRGTEDGVTDGLGLIRASVERFSEAEVGARKIPHIGFNSVSACAGSCLFEGLPSAADFYFVHSYRMLPSNLSGGKSICNYGVEFLAAYEEGNIYATQFHPEKSQTNGLRLLRNFLMQ